MTDAHQQQRYRVVERLASGGMAEVFLAESAGIEGFKKQVAIKRVLPHLSEKKRFIAMFLDEARLSASLSHSNVAQVFDIGVGDNAYFIVMEYVDGADLKAVIEFMKREGQRFPVESACFIAAKICEGLTYAHELRGADGAPLQIVHRDMSPPNVLITKHGEIKIVDFGLAKATSQLEKSEAGIIKGKFSYLSPEAAQGQDVDARTDIFAVGIILWEMLSGKRLFLGDSDYATVKLVQSAKIPSLCADNPGIPPELDAILARALARDPAARYSSTRDLGRDLTNFLYKLGRPVSAYDIAELVRGAMALRKKSQPDKASIIDKLIEEALLEFTSLQDDKAAPASTSPDKPLDPGGFEDIGNWADEIASTATSNLESGDLVRASLPSGAFVEGNLAALEDDDPVSSKPKAPSPAEPPPAEPGAALAAPSPPSTRSLAPPSSGPAPSPPASSGVTRLLLLVLALAVLAAGAWFGGLIPR
jgi:serine/threonine-protein kinase